MTRRRFLAASTLGAVGLLLPDSAEAQAPPQPTAPNQPPTTLGPLDAAELARIEAETKSLQAAAKDSRSGDTLFGLSPFEVGSASIALVGFVIAAGQYRLGRIEQSETKRSEQLKLISKLLNSTEQIDRNEGAEQLMMTMARSPSRKDQEQVFTMARGALRRRQSGDDVRVGDYELNLLDAFFGALPAARRSKRFYKEAFAGPDEVMDPHIDLEGINLSGAKLFGQDLRRTHMSRGKFRGTRFNNSLLGPTNFNGCDLRGAIFIHLTQRRSGWKRARPNQSDLNKVWFQNADLRGAIFRARYLAENPNLFKNIAHRAANIEGLVLLGGSDDESKGLLLRDDQLDVLTGKGALYIPKDHDQYEAYYDLTRTPAPSSVRGGPGHDSPMATREASAYR